MLLDSVVAVLQRRALIPVLERDEEEGAIGRVHTTQHAVADNRAHILHAWGVENDLLDDLRCLGGALRRRGVRKLQAAVHVSLILVGEKAAGHMLAEKPRANDEQEQKQERKASLVDEMPAGV